MDKKEQEPKTVQPPVPEQAEPKPAAARAEEEHKGGNYMFALKVLAILAAIILVIVILQASGVSVAVRDWFRTVTEHAAVAVPLLPLLPLF